MARELTFRIGRKTFRAAPVKIDRRKLYGWAGIAAYDDAGGPCTVVSTDETGTLIIPKGGTAVGLLSPDGRWVERSELRTVRADGSPAELLASSFTGVVALERKVSDEEFLDHDITDFYELRTEDGEPAERIGETIFGFDYCYNDGCEGNPAFVLTADGRLFLLIGRRLLFDLVGYEEPGYLDEETADEEPDDTFDFAMFAEP